MFKNSILKSKTLTGLAWAKPVIPKHIAAKILSIGGLRLEPLDLKGDSSIHRYKDGARCALTMSLDFEYPQHDPERAPLLREATLAILRATERFAIPMTWAICGNVALNEIPLLSRIESSRPTHELAVHTFSHRYVGSPDCPPNVLRDEVNDCVGVIRGIGHSGVMRTFTFPGNHVGNLNTLYELGFIAYRGEETGLGYPCKTQGLWKFSPTYFLGQNATHDIDLLKGLLNLSLAYECVIHLWSHPWNMVLNGRAESYARAVLEPFFRYADSKRREGSLWICTMGEMAEYCETRWGGNSVKSEADPQPSNVS
jgi:peptidoglycan/xylan/chitin deacetylase (PgdA/CDA1 family)